MNKNKWLLLAITGLLFSCTNDEDLVTISNEEIPNQEIGFSENNFSIIYNDQLVNDNNIKDSFKPGEKIEIDFFSEITLCNNCDSSVWGAFSINIFVVSSNGNRINVARDHDTSQIGTSFGGAPFEWIVPDNLPSDLYHFYIESSDDTSLNTEAFYFEIENDSITPSILNAGYGCDNRECVWISGKYFDDENIRVEVRRAKEDWEIVGVYEFNEIDVFHNSNEDIINLKLKTQRELDLFESEGLRLFIVNSKYGTFSDYGASNITYQSVLKPVITNAGSGCDDKNCIWIIGNGFEDNHSRVEVRDGLTWEIIGRYSSNEITNSNNTNNEVITLRLKSQKERNTFRVNGLRVFVINELNGEWSRYGTNVITKQ